MLDLFSTHAENKTEKIEITKNIFNATGASKATQDAIENYTKIAFETLDKMKISEDKKQILKAFGENLMNRKV